MCLCVLACLSVQCFGGIVENYYTDVCVCVCGIVCLHPSSMRLHFPKQGVFSAGDNNVPSH